MTPKIFRTLVIGEVVAFFAIIFLLVVFEPKLPQELADYKIRMRDMPSSVYEDIVLACFTFAYIVGAIGMYLFKSWGRLLYTIAIITNAIPFDTDPTISSYISDSLNTAMTTLTGFIVAIAYFSPISDLFNKDKSDV